MAARPSAMIRCRTARASIHVVGPELTRAGLGRIWLSFPVFPSLETRLSRSRRRSNCPRIVGAGLPAFGFVNRCSRSWRLRISLVAGSMDVIKLADCLVSARVLRPNSAGLFYLQHE